jgi:hypothetical protein
MAVGLMCVEPKRSGTVDPMANAYEKLTRGNAAALLPPDDSVQLRGRDQTQSRSPILYIAK